MGSYIENEQKTLENAYCEDIHLCRRVVSPNSDVPQRLGIVDGIKEWNDNKKEACKKF